LLVIHEVRQVRVAVHVDEARRDDPVAGVGTSNFIET
jgi:hypothetical protein